MSGKPEKLETLSTIVMGTSPKGTTYNHHGEGLPLLNGPTEFGPDYPHCTLYTTDPKRECEPGDLIFCVRGSTTGRMNWADQKYALGRGVCSFRGRSPAETHFIRYALETHLKQLLQYAGGATFPNLTKETLHSFTIPYPDNWNTIVDIISAYDESIQVNRRRIQLLEQSARLLYKEWFAHLRFPGHEHVKIKDGVPEGWEITSYDELFGFLGGFAFKSKTYQNEGAFGIVTIKNVHDATFIPECPSRLSSIPEKMKEHCVLSTGDILLSLTGNVGRACIVYGENYLLNQRVAKVVGKNVPRSYVYWTFSNESTQRELENLAYGVAQLNLSPVKLGSREFIKPPSMLIEMFAAFCEPMFSQICTLNIQNHNLMKARDILLPRMMNGGIGI